MDIKLDSLIPFDKLKSDLDRVFQIAEKNGKVILLRDDQPVYLIVKYEDNMSIFEDIASNEAPNYTLQEAMRLVLMESDTKAMHAAALADQIYHRKLYLKKDGSKAEYNQIRARCGHYPDLFEAMPGNIIKLKK